MSQTPSLPDDPPPDETTAPVTPVAPTSADVPAPASPKAEARAAEAAAIRRRWINLGEVLAVLAVLISGLTLWNSWSERTESKAEKAAQAHQASTHAAKLVLTAAPSGKRILILTPTSADQSVQSQTVTFPSAIDASPAVTTGEPRIEAGWFERQLVKAREAAGMPDASRGDDVLPVAITTRFLVEGEAHEDVALYDVGYTVTGRLLGGHDVTLRGLSLVAHAKTGDAQAKLDARWARVVPTKK